MKTKRTEPARAKQVGGTIQKSIGEYFSAYVNDLVNTGRYCSVAEVLREALRLHEQQTRGEKCE